MIEVFLGQRGAASPVWERRGPESVFFAGLDLGQAQDYTALAVVEAAESKGEWDAARYCFRRERMLWLRHLERMPLGRPYPEMVERVARVMGSGSLAGGKRHLAVDATGVGRPVVDLLRREKMACTMWPAVITGAAAESSADGVYRVPKRELLVGLQVMLQAGELRIAAGVNEAGALLAEMSAMRLEVTENGRDGWRSGAHDDLVFAVALACWAARKNLGRAREWW